MSKTFGVAVGGRHQQVLVAQDHPIVVSGVRFDQWLVPHERCAPRIVEWNLDDRYEGAGSAGGRVVDEQAVVLEVRHSRGRVRATASGVCLRPGAELHLADQLGVRQIADVEDVKPLEAHRHRLSVAEPARRGG